MKMFMIALVIVSACLLTEIDGNCKLPEKKLKKLTNTYHKKCLKKGFESSLAGCESQGNPEDLKPAMKRKCNKMQKKLNSCDVSCQVAGGWSDFGAWSSCSADCGGGEMRRERECNNPAPENGGAECQGDKVETKSCNTDTCPVNGGWGAWGDWSECSAKCEGGTQTRSKKCNNPAPANGGAECEGESTESQECNTQPCTTQYTIIHNTGTDKYNGGATSGAYMFTLIGTEGETSPHDCPADRTAGERGECTIEDAAKIGKLKGMRIKNKSDNMWVFVTMKVRVDGVTRGKWSGNGKVEDYKTKTINLNYIGDEKVEYEIEQTTGTGTWDGGARSGAYLFTLIGSEGETSPADCSADRSQGGSGRCTIKDAAVIGKLSGVRIKNTSDNTWVFVSMSVKVNGVARGVWMGTGNQGRVSDYRTLEITLKTVT